MKTSKNRGSDLYVFGFHQVEKTGREAEKPSTIG
jgi:hypothetical protein